MTVVVSCKSGVVIKYQSLNNVVTDLEVGQSIQQGDVIGVYGDSALMEMADEPHLHLMMMINGEPVDPTDYMQ